MAHTFNEHRMLAGTPTSAGKDPSENDNVTAGYLAQVKKLMKIREKGNTGVYEEKEKITRKEK